MLNPSGVEKIFKDCLCNENEVDGAVKAEGITCTVGFDPAMLEKYRQQIVDMLNELPKEFHKETGGGWSFLNAWMDKDGNQWTSFHQQMEQLFQLGIGIGKVKCLMPKKLWAALPGGMPYYVITK